MSFSAIPTNNLAITSNGKNDRSWNQFFIDIWKGKPQGSINSLAVGTSPFTYQVTTKGFIVVQGGTVSLIQFTRDGVTNVNTGVTSGCIPLAQGDSIIVTYSIKPNMTWIPL